MQSSLMSCWLQIWLLLFSGMVVAYLSPVYEVLPELHQAFSCPNNTPLHFLNSHFTRYFNITGSSEMMLACMCFLAAKVIGNHCSCNAWIATIINTLDVVRPFLDCMHLELFTIPSQSHATRIVLFLEYS